MTTCPIDQSFNQHDALMCRRDAHDDTVAAIAENMLATLPVWAANIIEANSAAYDAVIALAEKSLADNSSDSDSWNDLDLGGDDLAAAGRLKIEENFRKAEEAHGDRGNAKTLKEIQHPEGHPLLGIDGVKADHAEHQAEAGHNDALEH